MKRVLMILFCVCVLSVPAFAVELSDFEYLTVDGTYEINYDSYYYSLAQEKIAVSGVALDANDYWVDNGLVSPGEPLRYFDNAAFEADYAAALAALQESEQSDGTDNAISDTSISNEPSSDVSSDNKYPLGSFIDEEGNVYSPEGELLSTGTETIPYLDAIAPVLDEVETTSDETLVGDEVSESHVYNVVDMRSSVSVLSVSEDSTSDSTVESGVLSDLKALIVSIFGEYTPVTTTAAITETVDGVTTTTLIDTVADGAAGVDYAWLAGVFLFGILLFCLMKLLGGILK